MRKMLLLVTAAGLLSLAAAQGVAGAGNGTYVCTGDLFGSFTTFTGTTKDLVVPPGNACVLEGATVTHDVIVEMYDWTGRNSVGHDVVISGSSANSAAYGGWDVCGTAIGHDLSIAGGNVWAEIEVGDQGAQDNEFCTGAGTDSVGHDVTVSNNTAGKVDVGNDSVGHDLVVTGNSTSATSGDSQDIGVDDNSVNHG